MSEPRSQLIGPMSVPTLAELQADASILDRQSVDVLVELRRQVRHLESELDAAIQRRAVSGRRQPDVGRVIDVDAAADRLNTSPDSLYRKRKRLRLGYIDPLDGRLKFTEDEISEYIRRQRRG